MKRLMIALSAAAMAFGLKAADAGFISGTSFEDDAAGTYSAASPLWTTVEDANRTLTVTAGAASYSKECGRPVQWETASDTKTLAVKTTLTKPIEMNVIKEEAAGSQTIGDGVYFDSLVKFTVCDEAPDTTSYTGAKVMVWLQEDTAAPATNFYVRAGKYVDSAWTTADWKCSAISGFDVDGWHRLTIKAIKDIYEKASAEDYVPGFVVFVDGAPLECTLTKTQSGIEEDELNGSASEFFDAANLFVSMVQGEASAKNTISAVGFAGQGSLDDLAITTSAPSFAGDKEARIASVGSTVCYSVEGISNAIAAATADSTITILRSITESTDLILTGSQNFTLDLNGKTISGGINGSNDPLYAGTLTIDDSVGTGKVDGTLAAGNNNIVLNAGKYLASANSGIQWVAVAKTGYEITLNGDYYEITEVLEDGTAAKPWQIKTADDFTSKFEDLASLDAAHQNFKLMANVDFDGDRFDGIGTAEAPFKGVFDGDGKTISNYKLPAVKTYEGFFMVSTNATIKNVTFDIAGFEDPGVIKFGFEYGGAAVAGVAHGAAKFINVTANGTIKGGATNDVNELHYPNHTIAGIAVQTTGAAEFTDCTNNVNIVSAQNKKTAGFVSTPKAYAANTALKFTRCVNNGNIALGAAATGDGGTAAFTGWTCNYNVTFENCANKGAIASVNTAQLGSFCGKLYSTCSAAIVGTCTTTAANIPAMGTNDLQATEAPDFNFATVADGVATFPATPAAGGTYKVMLPTAEANVSLALSETIAFDTGVAAGRITVTAADATANKITSSTEGTVTTYTCEAKTAITAVTLAASTVEFGTAEAPAATVKAGEETVDPANYELSYTPEYSAETVAGTVITVTATAKGDDYTGSASTTFTVVEKSVTPEITFDTADIVEWTNELKLPTVTVGDYEEDTDYTKAWDPSVIAEPEAGATNTYTVTVTMMGNYTGVGTKEFKVWKAAGAVTPSVPTEEGKAETSADGKTVTVTPGVGITQIHLSNVGATVETVFVPSSVTMIYGVDESKLRITYTATEIGSETIDITQAFIMNGDATEGISYELNPDGSVVVEGETVKVQPTLEEAASTEGTIADGAVKTKAIPGLTYTLKRQTSLGSSATKEDADSKTATSGTVSLKDGIEGTKPAAAFYTIEVTK